MDKNVKFLVGRLQFHRKVGKAGHLRAFTLLEVLAVMSIIVIMLGFSAPLVQSLKGPGNLTRAAFDISGTLEKARAYAMANNTYVFVGFSERDGLDASKLGNGQIFMVTMGSKDGTQSFGPSNSNLVNLSRVAQFKGMHFEDALPNVGKETRPEVEGHFSMGNPAFAAQDSFVASGYQFNKIIQFDPRGAAAIQTSDADISQWMEIGLVAAKGNTVGDSQNWAALVLDGVTGSVRIYRP